MNNDPDPDPYGLLEFRELVFNTDPNMTPEKYAVCEERIKTAILNATRDLGEEHVLCSPLFDILSVSLRLKLPSPPLGRGYWRIFGDIYITQDDDPPTHQNDSSPELFSSTYQNSQPLDPSSPFLDFDNLSPIVNYFPKINLHLDLSAKLPRDSHHKLLIKDVLVLDYTDFPDRLFDRVQQHDFETENVFLRLKYIAYRAACIVNVNFSIDELSGQPSRGLAVSGRIFASWQHNKEDFEQHQEHEDRCSCVCLFNSISTKVTPGQPFKLNRSTFAAPAYATLMLEVNLRVKGVDCYCVLNVPVIDSDTSDLEFQVSTDLVGRVKIKWAEQYIYDSDSEGEEAAKEKTNPPGCPKKTKLTLPQVPKPICIDDTVLDLVLVGNQMMEIFSVYVELNDKSNVCRLSGTIDVEDGFSDNHRIFDITDPNLTKKISHGTSLALVGLKTCLRGPCFLQVNLKDDKDEEFCRGHVGWSPPLLRSHWLDKFLCSVVKGKLGFAEFHYALLTNGVSCAVSVFLSAPSICENVHVRGSIYGQYDLEYSTTFDKNYYRSVLLHERDESESMILEFGARKQLIDMPTRSRSTGVMPNKYWISVPLAKSAICVPTDNTLLIEVDLSVECETLAPAERLMGCMEFQVGHKTWYVVKSDNYQLFVNVDWS